MDARYQALTAVLSDYFDGLFHSDTDLLTFVFVDGRWQIISKVFHYDLRS